MKGVQRLSALNLQRGMRHFAAGVSSAGTQLAEPNTFYWEGGEEMYNVDEPTDLAIGMICNCTEYEKNLGDVEYDGTFNVPTHLVTIDGLSFQACCEGIMTPYIEKQIRDAVDYFTHEKKVEVITGNSGMMFAYQHRIAKMTHVPVVMSSLPYLPMLGTFYDETEKICLVTAHAQSLEDGLKREAKELFGFDLPRSIIDQLVIVGLDDDPTFWNAMSHGYKLPYHSTQRTLLQKLRDVHDHHNFKCFLIECTQMPQFSDAIRYEFDHPVFDIVTLVEAVVAGKRPNLHFGDYRRILPQRFTGTG